MGLSIGNSESGVPKQLGAVRDAGMILSILALAPNVNSKSADFLVFGIWFTKSDCVGTNLANSEIVGGNMQG